tara:strand:- start:7318 stop:8172 length:855 start_codon:yes stop_codon:yes gene_type:complete
MADKRKKGLTDVERAILSKLDQGLKEGTMTDLQLAAKQIAKLWNEEHTAFQSQLIVRAERWRRAYNKARLIFRRTAMHEAAALMRLMHIPGIDPPIKEDMSVVAGRRNPVLPSLHHEVPKTEISAEEMGRFMELMETESFVDIFDYGNKIINDQLYRPPLVWIQKKPVFYDEALVLYQDSGIDRLWDEPSRSPEIALALDLVLIVSLASTKWTWTISDDYLGRLPPKHPMKTTIKGRPGWKELTAILAEASLLQLRAGQTWELTEAGENVAKGLTAQWADADGQ